MNENTKIIVSYFKNLGWKFEEIHNKTCMYMVNGNDELLQMHLIQLGDNYGINANVQRTVPYKGLYACILHNVNWDPEFNSGNHTDSWGLQKHFEGIGYKATSSPHGRLYLSKNCTNDQIDETIKNFYVDICNYFPRSDKNLEGSTCNMIVEVKQPTSLNSQVEFYLPNVYHIKSNTAKQDIRERFKVPPECITSIKDSLTYRRIELFIPKECHKKQEIINRINSNMTSKDIYFISYNKIGKDDQDVMISIGLYI